MCARWAPEAAGAGGWRRGRARGCGERLRLPTRPWGSSAPRTGRSRVRAGLQCGPGTCRRVSPRGRRGARGWGPELGAGWTQVRGGVGTTGSLGHGASAGQDVDECTPCALLVRALGSSSLVPGKVRGFRLRRQFTVGARIQRNGRQALRPTPPCAFVAALPAVPRLCPLSREWTSSMRPLHTLEYDSALKRSEAPTLATLWRGLEHGTLSERSQTHEGHPVCDSVCVKCPEQAQPQRQNVT